MKPELVIDILEGYLKSYKEVFKDYDNSESALSGWRYRVERLNNLKREDLNELRTIVKEHNVSR